MGVFGDVLLKFYWSIVIFFFGVVNNMFGKLIGLGFYKFLVFLIGCYV